MHLLRAARDNKDGDLARLEHARGQDVDVADIEDAAVGFQARRRVLLGQRAVDLELGGGQPELEGIAVAFDVGVEYLGQYVLAHFPEERLDLEGRVHFAELLDDHGGFVFGEKAGDAVGDAAGGGDEGVFRLGVGGSEGEEGLHEAVGVAEVAPGFFPARVFVDGYVCTGAVDGVSLDLRG